MQCIYCKQGETQPGTVTVTLQRAGTTIIVKDVPAIVCENCGEYFLDEHVTGELLRRAEQAVSSGAEVEILRYAA